jgi:hypothetical protein
MATEYPRPAIVNMEDTAPTTNGESSPARRKKLRLDPTLLGPLQLLVNAECAGFICGGRGESTWQRDDAAGLVPAPIKLAGATLWSVDELRAWVAAGCPPRDAWERMKITKK